MKIEPILLIAATVIFLMSIFFVPKANRLQAQFIFLFIQFPTWILGLIAVESGLLEYPVHELSRANSTSFVFEYMILPIYCVHFNARFPSGALKFMKLLYYCGASLFLTFVEVIVERYTQIIHYTGWHWYFTFFSVLFILWLSRLMVKWFFKDIESEPAEP
jgi:hypothetical protein